MFDHCKYCGWMRVFLGSLDAACHCTLRDGARGAYSTLENRLASSLSQLHGFQRDCRKSKIQLVKLLGTVEVSTCHIFTYFAYLVFRLWKPRRRQRPGKRQAIERLLHVFVCSCWWVAVYAGHWWRVSQRFVIFHPSFIPEFVWKAYAWMDSGDEGDEGSEGQQLARARLTRSFTWDLDVAQAKFVPVHPLHRQKSCLLTCYLFNSLHSILFLAIWTSM